MNPIKPYDQYTESEFLEMINRLFLGEYSSEEELDTLVHQIVDASEHPNGTDILFYPEQDIDNSPTGILNSIKEWRKENGKPGFKPE
ncbi:bacteriocin immunity protein [Pseudomonas sp. 008]|uniref:bacteriocin immunity protein n=1 Tax=Pseudomonas sp. 008 TaxID=2803906 RepID=UPI00194F631E|nr:bacteriocin immunity protein [Pseudomonas sp. 008]GID04747.1 colicin transporter [Pseudomonas sp. 008]